MLMLLPMHLFQGGLHPELGPGRLLADPGAGLTSVLRCLLLVVSPP